MGATATFQLQYLGPKGTTATLQLQRASPDQPNAIYRGGAAGAANGFGGAVAWPQHCIQVPMVLNGWNEPVHWSRQFAPVQTLSPRTPKSAMRPTPRKSRQCVM